MFSADFFTFLLTIGAIAVRGGGERVSSSFRKTSPAVRLQYVLQRFERRLQALLDVLFDWIRARSALLT